MFRSFGDIFFIKISHLLALKGVKMKIIKYLSLIAILAGIFVLLKPQMLSNDNAEIIVTEKEEQEKTEEVKHNYISEKILSLNDDKLEDQAVIAESDKGLSLEVYLGDKELGFKKIETKEILWDKENKKPVLLKQKFESADTLILLKKYEDAREKTKILLRKGALIVGGYHYKSKDLVCDINFLNKKAHINGQEIKHKESIKTLSSWDEELGMRLCLEKQEALVKKE